MRVEPVASRRSTGQSVHTGLGVRNPLDPRQRIRAVLFDLDGTLYDQRRMRVLMAAELLTLLLSRPLSAPRSLRALSAYRKAQEILRDKPFSATGPRKQLEVAAERVDLTPAELERVVNEWMFERPLKYMHYCRASGLLPLLNHLQERDIELGVLSDYPAEAKLGALGLANRFSIVLCSSDPEVRALKPNPRGFFRACERWHIEPRHVLVVGDRADVDARGAAAAGMPCVIIGRSSHSSANQGQFLALPSLERLRSALDEEHCG
jgi:HAD superfamily hydrolase (TIGR01549 family)